MNPLQPTLPSSSPLFASDLPQTGHLQDKEVAPIPNHLLGHWGWGVMWAGFFGLSLWDFISAKNQWDQAGAVASPDVEQKVGAAQKKLILKGVSLAGTTAHTADWAHSAGFFPLGEAAKWIKGIAYGATAIMATASAVEAVQQFEAFGEKFQKATTDEERSRAWHRQAVAVVNLIGAVTMIAWAILGIGCMIAGAVLLPAITGALMGISLVFTLGGIFYKSYLDNQQKSAEESLIPRLYPNR